MKKAILLLMFVSFTAFAQKSINNYKYVIVPNQFDFLNEPDKYQTSSLTQFLFNREKFSAFKSDEQFPNDLAQNRCLALTTNLIEDSTIFGTKIIIQLKDCANNIVFTSEKGRSKLKDYKKAYHEAIRKAFRSIESLNYRYVPGANDVVSVVKNPNKGIAELPMPTSTRVPSKSTGIKVKQPNKNIAEMPMPTSTPIPSKSTGIKVKQPKKNIAVLPTKDVSNNVPAVQVLYAQPNGNGYQLVNTKPAVVFQILPLSAKNFYVIKDKNGVFYNNRGVWIAEYYKNGTKVVEQYNVKF